VNALLLSNIEAASEAVAAEAGGLSIEGPLEIFSFELFGMSVTISESITVQWVVMLFLGILFFILGRKLKIRPDTKRQAIAETLVGTFAGMVKENMGKKYFRYAPYIAVLFMFSICLSLSGLFGFRPPTADVSVIAGWGVVTFILTQRNRFKTMFQTKNFKGGVLYYANPLNLISEFSSPMAQTLRHFGNILAGVVIGGIIYWALGSFAVAIPAAASAYFDIFAGVLQAFIFITLTMVYVAMAEVSPKKVK
jgi:F-type H+-transporting ATPase subunit a